MSIKKFERFARKKLEEETYPVDVEAIWEAVEPEVRPRKRRRFLFLWITFGFGLLMSLLFFGTSNKAAEANEETYPQEKTIGEEQVVFSRQKTEKQNLEPTKKSSTSAKQITTTPSIVSTSENINTQKGEDKTIAFNTTEESLLKEINETLVDIPENISTPALTIQTTKGLIEEKELKEETEHSEKEDRVVAELENTNTLVIPKTENKEPKEKVFFAETKAIDEEKENILEEPKENKLAKTLSQMTIGLGIRGGISNQFVNFSAKDSIGEIVLQNRSETETNLEMLDVGFEVLLSIKRKWYIRSGIDYQRAITRFTFKGQLIQYEEVEGLVKSIQNPFNKVTTNEFGLIQETTETVWNKEIFNKTHFINTPLMIGMELPIEKWSLGIEAGTLINWSIRQNGQIRDARTFYSLQEDLGDWFKDKAEISFLGSVQVGYSLRANTQLLVGAVYRSPITLSDKNNPVVQKQSSIGLQLTARYWLMR